MIVSPAVDDGHHVENPGDGNKEAFEGNALSCSGILVEINVFERGWRNAF
jgi:hypothetical protein